jgi:hypothetical protein
LSIDNTSLPLWSLIFTSVSTTWFNNPILIFLIDTSASRYEDR